MPRRKIGKEKNVSGSFAVTFENPYELLTKEQKNYKTE